jgi:hypothetical protein
MTPAQLIEVEARVRHKFHRLERVLAALRSELEVFADDLAESQGIPANDRSGGDDKPAPGRP